MSGAWAEGTIPLAEAMVQAVREMGACAVMVMVAMVATERVAMVAMVAMVAVESNLHWK